MILRCIIAEDDKELDSTTIRDPAALSGDNWRLAV